MEWLKYLAMMLVVGIAVPALAGNGGDSGPNAGGNGIWWAVVIVVLGAGAIWYWRRRR
jgi:LPXTG-motif cell wall-anchored protein